MTLDEMAIQEEASLSEAQPILGVATAKLTLREGIAAFERELEELPSDQREEATRLYLHKLRKATYSFHFALRYKLLEQAVLRDPKPCYEQYSNGFEKKLIQLFRLYRIRFTEKVKRCDRHVGVNHPY